MLIASREALADVDRAVFLGELALDGSVRHAQGVLPMVALARERGIETAFVPEPDAHEAALIEGIRILPVNNLVQVMAHLSGESPIEEATRDGATPTNDPIWDGTDFAEIRGQEHVKRALEVAASGGHNVLML